MSEFTLMVGKTKDSAMTDRADDIDHDEADEEILGSAVADEALEAAAGTEGAERYPTNGSYVCC